MLWHRLQPNHFGQSQESKCLCEVWQTTAKHKGIFFPPILYLKKAKEGSGEGTVTET